MTLISIRTGFEVAYGLLQSPTCTELSMLALKYYCGYFTPLLARKGTYFLSEP